MLTNGCTGQIFSVTFFAKTRKKAAIKNLLGEPSVGLKGNMIMVFHSCFLRLWGQVFIFGIVIALLSTLCVADEQHIIVTFYEGYYKESTIKDSSKYYALVTVWRCNPGFEKLGQFRGSTLPNPYWVYKDSDGNSFDTDGQLHDAFNKLYSLNLESIGLGALQKIVQIFQEDKKYPIVLSGKYNFDVVKHTKYKPRALLIAGGGFVPTINSNPNQGDAFKADEIFIHRGRYTGVNRDSAGCLTIDPSDWDKFIQLFPKEEEWNRNGYSGGVEVIRGSSYISPPRCLRIVP